MRDKPATFEDLGRKLVDLFGRSDQSHTPMAGDTLESGMPEPMMPMVMDNVGSMIEGDEDGAPVELLIGTEDQVLTVVDIGAGELRPRWADSTGGGGSSGQYRSYMYSTYGGGSFLFDSDGHAMYTLEDLE